MSAAADEARRRVVALYDENAQTWAGLRSGSTMEGAWLARFEGLLPIGGHVLDLGCGSGEPLGRSLAESGFWVTGVDASPALIALARERLPEQRWLNDDMCHLDLGRAFDGIVCWHSLFHLSADEQRALFPRLAAHSRPGTALMITSGDSEGVRLGEWQSEPLYHASLAPEEYEALLSANGFALVERRLGDSECGNASVWLAQMRPASGLEGSA